MYHLLGSILTSQYTLSLSASDTSLFLRASSLYIMRLNFFLVFHHKYFADFYVTLTVNNVWTQDVMTTSVGVILNNAARLLADREVVNSKNI